METRKITIINSKTQSQKVIENSQATTLGELKAEMRQLGIDYSGMAFMEGHIRAELKDDASILPTNIPYKGQVVNDLTFLLTAPEKKIKFRKALFAYLHFASQVSEVLVPGALRVPGKASPGARSIRTTTGSSFLNLVHPEYP